MTTKNVGLLVLLACVGCGGGSVSREQLGQESYKSLCAYYAHCGLVTSTSACITYLQTLSSGASSTRYDKGIAAGKIKYDGAAAAKCFQDTANLSCTSGLSIEPASCDGIYTGTVSIGSSCGDFECVAGSYCTSEVDLQCPGTCKARVEAGGAATRSSQCALGLILFDGLCNKPPAAGSTCATQASAPCADTLICTSDTRICAKPKLSGDSCDASGGCDTFLNCLNGKCAAPGDVGVSCASPGAKLDYPCKLDFYCDVSAPAPTCKQRLPAGQPCFGYECALDLECFKGSSSATSKTCAKRATKGQACDLSAPGWGGCEPTLFCDQNTQTCLDKLKPGAACTPSTFCLDGFCSVGKCVAFDAEVCL